MFVRRFILIALVVLSTCAAQAAGLEEIQQRILKAYQDVRSLSATLNVETRVGTGQLQREVATSGEFQFLRHDGQTRTRTDVQSTTQWQGQDVAAQTVLRIHDGACQYVLTTTGDRSYAYKIESKGLQDHDPRKIFLDLKRDYDVAVRPEESIGGRNTYVIEGRTKAGQSPPYPRVRYYFDTRTGLMIKSIGYDKKNEPAQTATLTNLTINERIDPDRFVFRPPPGVEVVDETRRTVIHKRKAKTGKSEHPGSQPAESKKKPPSP